MKSYEQRETERKASAKASLKKFRDREKRDREETLRKIDQLKKENREIMQRTAVHKQVRWPGGQVVRWSGGQVVRWPGGQVVRWPGGQVVRWSGGQVVRWSGG